MILLSLLTILSPATQPAPEPEARVVTTELTVAPRAVDGLSESLHLRPDSLPPIDGNGAPTFLRAALVSSATVPGDVDGTPADVVIGNLVGEPPEDVPLETAAKAVMETDDFRDTLEVAVRHNDVAWGLPLETQGFYLMLPELNQFRQMANVLRVDSELAIHKRKAVSRTPYWDANADPQLDDLDPAAVARRVADNSRLTFGLADAAAGQPLLVSSLVGAGIDAMTYRGLEQLIGAGGPNLLPALRALGEPAFDLPRMVRAEAGTPYATFPTLRRARDGGAVTDAEARAVFDALLALADADWSGEDRGAVAWTDAKAAALAAGYDGSGRDVLRWMADDFDRRMAIVQRAATGTTADLITAGAEAGDDLGANLLATSVMPSFNRTARTFDRLRMHHRLLVLVEELRHAAATGGLPETHPTPADITYERTADGFTLTAAPATDPNHVQRYVVTVRD